MADDSTPPPPAGIVPAGRQRARGDKPVNVADQVLAMQRRNLAAAANAAGPRSRQTQGLRESRLRTNGPARNDDFSRALPGQPSNVQPPSRELYNPGASQAQGQIPALTQSQNDVQHSNRVNLPKEHASPGRISRPRGDDRRLFDASSSQLQSSSRDRDIRREAEYMGSDSDGQTSRRERGKGRPPPASAAGQPQRKLFDPRVHDPVRFSTTSHAPPLPVPGPRRAPKTVEEEADRERERRKRREGSERGSVSVGSGLVKKEKKERDADGRSKGSRSSEGSESFKDRERGKGKGDTGIMAILRESYKHINSLELQLVEIHRKMSSDPALGILVYLANRDGAAVDERSWPALSPLEEGNAWVELIARHKRLADAHHDFLILALDPQLPSSLHGLPIRYNIPARLWQTGFHLILERLRYSWASAATSTISFDRNGQTTSQHDPKAAQRMLDILTDFIYDAYTFYTSLLEEQALGGFKTAWIEALGDLARYRMAIASHVDAAEQATAASAQPAVFARIDDDDGESAPQPAKASIGADVADSWEIEDRETWRTTARDWYAMGITEKPGEGRLHHHLALLCRDVKGEEARALYHFSKSLTASHPFRTSRESILPLFDDALQSQRSLPDADAMALFVRLHGMLFTRIQLDDFDDVFARFMERLEEDVRIENERPLISQVDWLLMATTNLAAVLQYGSDEGLVKRAMVEVPKKGKVSAPQALMLHADLGHEDGSIGTEDAAEEGEDDGEDDQAFDEDLPILKSLSITDDETFPLTLTNALHLTFTTLEFALKHPTKIQGDHEIVNPYIPAILTFLATVLRQPNAVGLLEHQIPWTAMIEVFNAVPREIDFRPELAQKLVLGPPVPEDWCLRGMEWVGRKVYERGFWKGKQSSTSSRPSGLSGLAQPRIGERFASELDVLQADFDSCADLVDGIVEEVDGTDQTDGPAAISIRRWRRVAWAAGVIVKHVDGLSITFADPSRAGTVKIEPGGALDRKLMTWAQVRAREAEEERAKKGHVTAPVVEDVEAYAEEDSDEDDPELLELKERRKHLQSLVGIKAGGGKKERHHRSLNVLPGYTMLVFDTNVLLSALKLFSRVVESSKWTVIVPLPVITELDGLAKSSPPLGPAAAAAIAYLEKHMQSHNRHLKVQTSRGNYLSSLAIRTESIPQNSASSTEDVMRSMDDHILNVAVFQQSHHALPVPQAQQATKVLLLTFDRNLRVRARARGVEAADEKEMAKVLGKG